MDKLSLKTLWGDEVMFRTILFGFSIMLLIVFAFGCSGKTTVKEELIDTSPRQKAEEKKETVKEPQTEQEKIAEEVKKEENKEGSKGGPSSPLPSPGISGPGGGTTPTPGTPGGSGGPTEREGGKEAREKYMQDNLAYPGSEPYTGASLPDSPGFTGKTLLSKDPAGTVASWYMNKYKDKATMNQTKSGQGEEYKINIVDKENGYSASVLIHKLDQNNPTRILISLYNTE